MEVFGYSMRYEVKIPSLPPTGARRMTTSWSAADSAPHTSPGRPRSWRTSPGFDGGER